MHDIQGFIAAYGGWGLLLVSFVAATIVPLSSEVAVYAALRLGMAPAEVLIFASLGNCLGVMLNYGLGRWGSGTILKKTLAGRAGRRAHAWSERYGKWTLLLSWLPVVGDPLTIIAGVMRVNLLFFMLAAFSVRTLRYGVIIALAS
jgi:membrane protein YqaA with SNARE-associated domain